MAFTGIGTPISKLSEKTEPFEVDVMVIDGDVGTKKITFANILNAIKSKFTSWEFNGLNTANKNVVSAVNELDEEIDSVKKVNEDQDKEIAEKNFFVYSGILNRTSKTIDFSKYPAGSQFMIFGSGNMLMHISRYRESLGLTKQIDRSDITVTTSGLTLTISTTTASPYFTCFCVGDGKDYNS